MTEVECLAVLAGGAEASARHKVIHRCVVDLVVLKIVAPYVPVGGLSVAVDALRPGGVTRDLAPRLSEFLRKPGKSRVIRKCF